MNYMHYHQRHLSELMCSWSWHLQFTINLDSYMIMLSNFLLFNEFFKFVFWWHILVHWQLIDACVHNCCYMLLIYNKLMINPYSLIDLEIFYSSIKGRNLWDSRQVMRCRSKRFWRSSCLRWLFITVCVCLFLVYNILLVFLLNLWNWSYAASGDGLFKGKDIVDGTARFFGV